MNVLINIVCRNEEDSGCLKSMVECCRSKKHNVMINICDYSLVKKANEEVEDISSDDFNLKVLELDYEDTSDHDKNLPTFMNGESYDVVIDLERSLELEPEFLDSLGLEAFDDDSYASVYSDFYSKTKNNHKIYVHQKSFPLTSTSLPILAFSVKHYLDNINKDNVKGVMLSSLLSRHTTSALCSILNA